MAWTLFQRLFVWASGKRIGTAPGQLDLNTEFDHTYTGINQLGADLDTHKAGADHDGRYYTETETDSKIAQAAIGIIPLNSIDGNKLVNSTVTQAKLNFTPATLDGTGHVPIAQLPDSTALAGDLDPFVASGLTVYSHYRMIRFNTPLPTDVSIAWSGNWYREWTDASDGGSYYANNTANNDIVTISYYGSGLAILTASVPSVTLSIVWRVDGGAWGQVNWNVLPAHLTHDVPIVLVPGIAEANHTVDFYFLNGGQVYVTGFVAYSQAFYANLPTWKVTAGTAWAGGTRVAPALVQFTNGVTLTNGAVSLMTVSPAGVTTLTSGVDRSTGGSSGSSLLYRIDARDFNYSLTANSDGITWWQKRPDGSPLIWPHALNTRWAVNGFRRTLLTDTTKGPRAAADFYSQTAVASATADHFIAITWVGTDLDLITYIGPTEGIFGTSNDGGAETLRDNYNATVGYQQRIAVATNYKYGTHVTKIRVTGTKSGVSTGANIIVDAVDIRGPQLPAIPTGHVPLAYMLLPPQDVRAASPTPGNWPDGDVGGWIRFESGKAEDVGAWNSVADSAFSGGVAYQTVATGTSVALSFSFVGYRVRVIGRRFTAGGIMAVSIDGGAETNVDLYSATDAKTAVVYTSAIINVHGVHTIRLRQTGTKNAGSSGNTIIIDSFEVQMAPYALDIRLLSPTKDAAVELLNLHTDAISTPHPHRQYLRLQDQTTYVNRGWRSEVSTTKVNNATTGTKSVVVLYYQEFMAEPMVFVTVSGPAATTSFYGITVPTTTGCQINYNAPAVGDYAVSLMAIGL